MFNYLIIKKLYLIFLFSLISISYGISQNWQKKFDKIETYYANGDYKKARELNSLLKSKSKKKLGPQNKVLASVYFREAKYFAAAGYMKSYRQSIQRGLEAAQGVAGKNYIDYAKTILEASRVLIDFGDFGEAEKLLIETQNHLKTEEDPADLKGEIKYQLLLLHAGQGFNKKAMLEIDSLKEYLLSTLDKTETYYDSKKKKKRTRKRSKFQKAQKKREFARYLTLHADVYKMYGDYQVSDSLYNVAEKWILKNLAKSDISFVRNYFHSVLSPAGRNVTKKDIKTLEKAHTYARRFLSPNHRESILIQEHLLKAYQKIGANGKFNTAKDHLTKAIERYYDTKNIYHITNKMIDLYVAIDKKNISDITQKAKSLLTNPYLPEFHEKRLEILDVLYKISLANDDYKGAKNNLSTALQIKSNLYGDHTPAYHLQKLKLCRYFLSYTDSIRAAKNIFDESFSKIVEKEITPENPLYIDLINDQADLYELFDSYQEASKALESALEATKSQFSKEDIRYGIALNRFANFQLKIGDYDRAAQNITHAIDILRKEKADQNVIHYARALETKAKLKLIQGEYSEAKNMLYKSRKFAERASITSKLSNVNTIDELADVYIKVGRYHETEKLLNQSITEKKRLYGDNSRKLIQAWNAYGQLKLIKGEFTEAEKYVRKALEIAVKNYGDNNTKTTPSLTILSEIFMALGDYDLAKKYAEKALSIREARFGAEHIAVAGAMAELAKIKFYNNEDPKEIETLLQKALETIENKLGNDNPIYARLIKDLASLFIENKDFEKAHGLLGEASKIWSEKIGKKNNINLAELSIVTGDIYYEQKQYAQAEENYQKANSIYGKIFNKNHPEYVKTISKLSRAYFMQGKATQAKKTIEEVLENYNILIKDYFPALSERQKSKYWSSIKSDFEFFNTLAFKYQDIIGQMYDNALITKSLLLNSSVKIKERIMNSGDTLLVEKFNQWLFKKETLTGILSMSTLELEENKINVDSLKEDMEFLEKELSERSELFATKIENKTINWKKIKSSLKKGEVAVEMLRFRYFDHTFTDSIVYALLFINHDSKKTPGVVFLKNGKALENKYYQYYKNALRFHLKDKYSNEQFWQPVFKSVGNYSTIYLSPDGVYNKINLEVIPTSEGHYVIDTANIIIVNNTKELYVRRKQKKKKEPIENTALIFGDPSFYASTEKEGRIISQLPGTLTEATSLQDMLAENGWKSLAYLNNDATEEEIKAINSPKVFHIATHGFFREDAVDPEKMIRHQQSGANPLLKSGLLLTRGGDILHKSLVNYNIEPGILTAYEAMSLNLDHTELVVLSACETGAGDIVTGEGVYGLQRAFLQAGAETVIMSLFKVSDEITQKLMSKFYEKWLSTGDKRQSFIDAKKEIRNEYPDPMYWGVFVMIGIDKGP